LKVLIIENEIYLAQSISTKLETIGYQTTIVTCAKDAIKMYKDDNFIHTILLSTNLDDDFNSVIKKYNKSIIILLNSYINNDTVTTPLKSGANDYMLKPLLMDELIRKIEHYKEFERLKNSHDLMEKYINLTLNLDEDINIDENLKLPLAIKTNSIKLAEQFIFKVKTKMKKELDFCNLKKSINIENDIESNQILYCLNFDSLNQQDRKSFINNIENKNVVIITIEDIELESEYINLIQLQSDESVVQDMKILPISEYVKLMIIKHQDKMPDIKISEMLGISRKSLWEKRKKYGIEKQ
jgi:DNA-binding NtrC family response regulator